MNTKNSPASPTCAQLLSPAGAALVKPPAKYPNYSLTRYRVVDSHTRTFQAERLVPSRTLEATGNWEPVYNEHLLHRLRSLVGA